MTIFEKMLFEGVEKVFFYIGPSGNGIKEDVWEPYVATIAVKFGKLPGLYEIGVLMGIRKKDGWARQIEYGASYSGVPFLGFESNLSSIGLDTPIFSPILNPYLAHYQTQKESLNKLRVSIRDTLNGLIANGDPQWVEEAIALENWQKQQPEWDDNVKLKFI